MIKINYDEIKKLEYVGSGKFGIVYKKDDKTAYKIYKETVKDDVTGMAIGNPSLTLSSIHYKLLLERSKKLKYSDGIKDLIYINGQFGGVVIPYHDGSTLNKLIDEPLKLKTNIAKEIVRNSKELSTHLIYPTDYKLNNILLSDNKVILIDLDDKRTHVSLFPNPVLKAYSINALGETIQTFFNNYKHNIIPKEVKKDMGRRFAFYSLTYNKIIDYINYMENEKKIIFINEDSNLDKIKELISNNNFELVYLIDEDQEKGKYINIVDNLKKENIKLFDFYSIDKIDTYSSIERVNESYLLDKKELKKVPQKN